MRIATRPNRPVTKVFGLRCRHGIRHLADTGKLAIGTLQSASRNHYERLWQTMEQGFSQLRHSSDDDERWQMAGCLWLGIGALLLTGFIFTL
jgi:hypothetical protein